jgi:hypothetical protein
MLTIDPVLCPRELTPKQKRVRDSLMRRKLYDQNHPEEKRRYPILFRAFIPANHQGNPSVLLVCQYTTPNLSGEFEYVVFSDGLYGRGHRPSDKFGSGTMADARAAFKEHLVYEVLGFWPDVIQRVLKDAKAFPTEAG